MLSAPKFTDAARRSENRIGSWGPLETKSWSPFPASPLLFGACWPAGWRRRPRNRARPAGSCGPFPPGGEAITSGHFERLTIRSADQQGCATVSNAQHLMRSGMVMLIVEDAVRPYPTPLVLGEHFLKTSWRRTSLSAFR